MATLKELFIEWELDVWANVLEVIGFIITIVTIVISIRIRSEVEELKMNHLIKKRLPIHRRNLHEKISSLKNHLNNYENSIEEIKESLTTIEAELVSLSTKLVGKDLKRVKHLIVVVKKKRSNQFRISRRADSWLVFQLKKILPKIFYTSYTDAWGIYTEVAGVIDYIDNSMADRKSSL